MLSESSKCRYKGEINGLKNYIQTAEKRQLQLEATDIYLTYHGLLEVQFVGRLFSLCQTLSHFRMTEIKCKALNSISVLF